MNWKHPAPALALFKLFPEGSLRYVGGAVRNHLLGKPPGDYDMATSLLPEAVLELLKSAKIKAIPTGIDHGTITALVKNTPIEITTLRTDIACDGRHAAVQFTDDWRKDAARRDFTFNALYVDEHGTLYDYFGGEADLRQGLVRFIGNPHKRIKEDYLRILRLFRFHAYYGKAAIEKDALTACRELSPHLAKLSGERIRLEMLKILAAEDPSADLEAMQKLGIFDVIAPGLPVNTAQLKHIKTPLVRLASLFSLANKQGDIKNLGTRWKLSNKEKFFLESLILIPANATDTALKEHYRILGKELFQASAELSAMQGKTTYLNDWQAPEFPLTGQDLLDLGIAAGKKMGEILRSSENTWVKSGYRMSKTDLLNHITREQALDTLLCKANIGHWQRQVIPGDASFRHYIRIYDDATSYIVMDAPPPQEDVRPFVKIALYLAEHDFSAPKILAENTQQGFLILEDLGNDSFTKTLARDSSQEIELYKKAVEALAMLHTKPAPDISFYDHTVLHREVQLLSDWYTPLIHGKAIDETSVLQAIWQELFDLLPASTVTVLRDYHADNLMWLPERKGAAKVGLLDFQDALIGHPAYDLVSLLEDARRDVPRALAAELIEYYLSLNLSVKKQDFLRDYAILGAQRNAKILGIFARLSARDKKPHYLKFLPRVWGHLEHDVQHPTLHKLRDWLDAHFEPSIRHQVPIA